jgi:hypothetical protein
VDSSGTHAPNDLPVLPETLIGVTSVSALAYVTTKAVANQKPSISAIVLADTAQGTTITGGGLLEIRGFNFVVDGVTNTSATQVRFAKSGDASTKFEVGANVDDKANPPRRVEANRLLVKVPACLRQGATSW